MDVFDIINQLVNKRKVEFTFINSTPWWGGNEFGYTFDDEGNVTIPSANTIVGKTRWLMRNIIAQIIGLNSFDGIDEKYFKDLGTLNAKSKITVRVIKEDGEVQPPYYFSKKEAACVFKIINMLMYWPTIKESRGKKERPYLDSKNLISDVIGRPITTEFIDSVKQIIQENLQIIQENLRKYKKLSNKLVNKLEAISHKKLQELEWSHLSDSAKEYFKYFYVPRFVLATMGKNDPLFYYHIQPAKPKSVKIKVEVINNGADEDFFNFFVSSLVFTMKYIGIGKAATRGFGRFILTDQQTSDLQAEFSNLLKLGILLVYKGAQKPNFDIPIIRIDNPQIFFFKEKRCEEITGKDPITYLIAIGNATLKVSWKRAIGKKYKDKGAAYHTWTLGLPRSQYKTGYLIGEKEGRRISYITISPICDGNTCDKIYLIPFIYEEKEDFEKLRYRGGHDKRPNEVKNLLVNMPHAHHSINSIKDYIYITLDWLKYILSCGRLCQTETV